MDYEQKYRKLVEAIKEMRDVNPSDEGLQNWINDNVPELAESEDERIRKALIAYFQNFPYDTIEESVTNPEETIAWLEKQDVVNSHIGKVNDMLSCLNKQDKKSNTAFEAIKEEKADNANKVKLKFKVGDWVVNKSGFAQQVLDLDRIILEGIIDEIEANKNEAPSYELPIYDTYLNWLESLKKKIKNK